MPPVSAGPSAAAARPGSSSEWGRASTIFDTLDAPVAAAGSAVARAAADHAARPASAFDVCNGGVVLRVVVFVHGALALAVGFTAAGPAAWLLDVASAATVALPATLLWLVAACLGQRLLARLSTPLQWLVAVGLGALSAALLWPAWLALDLAPQPRLGLVAPVLAGAALAAAVFQWLRQRARLQLPATTQARLAELQSRIRPHFLFNTLNSAIALVRLDPARAEEVLEDLSELFRVALTETGQRVSLAEEVQLARRYLAIEQVRFGPRLSVQWQVDAAAGAAAVPPLLLQPLVENAVKHGVEPSADGGEILIRTRRQGSVAEITVSNTVRGVDSAPGHGIALRNVRERLRLLHDIAADLKAGPVHGTGGTEYRVRITLPMD